MKTYKGRITVIRPQTQIALDSPFMIEAVGLPEALIQLFRMHGQRGQILKFSVTDQTLRKKRASWLKEEASK